MPSSFLTETFTSDPWWWEAARPRPTADNLLPKAVDVAVIGAGYTGLSAALTLAEAGREVLVLETASPGEGASTRNAGAVGRGLLGGFSELVRKLGLARAVSYYRGAEEAYEHVIDLMRKLAIPCHLVHCGRLLPTWNRAQYDATAADFEAQRRHLGIEGGMLSADEVAQELRVANVSGALLITNTSCVHPAMYHAGLLAAARAAGASVRGGCRVRGIERGRTGTELLTDWGTVMAREVVIATNAYTGSESPWHRRRLIATNAFMAATEPLDPALLLRLMPSQRIYIDYSRYLFNYWRPAPDSSRLLIGGQTGLMHRGPEAMARLLHADLERIFPELAGMRFTHLWQGRVAMTMDRLPHLGVRDGIHFALGCNGAGLPMGTYTGHKVALKLLGDPQGKTPFDDRPFPVSPSLFGYPWYLPVLTTWARFQDWRGVAAKGH